MLYIDLINMPCARTFYPALGIEQIRSILKKYYSGKVKVRLLYLNHDFAKFWGINDYSDLNVVDMHNFSFTTEWLFRQFAFPDSSDNANEYFGKIFKNYQKARDIIDYTVKEKRKKKRQHLPAFFESVVDKYQINKSHIVGFTCLWGQVLASLGMARLIKARNPKITTAVGGVSLVYPKAYQVSRLFPQIDFAFSGDGLKSFPLFVEHILNNEPEKCHAVNGVFSKQNCTALEKDKENIILPYSDKLPPDEFPDLDFDDYLDSYENFGLTEQRPPFLTAIISRGCYWNKCSFCSTSFSYRNYKVMNPERAQEHINNILKHNPRGKFVYFTDDSISTNQAKNVFTKLIVPKDTFLYVYIRADLTEEAIRCLKKSSVSISFVGIESLSSPTLKIMNKGCDLLDNIVLLKRTVKNKLFTAYNMLVGVPGEKECEYQNVLNNIPKFIHLFPPSSIFQTMFERYSEFYNNPDKFNLKLRPMVDYSYTFPVKDSELLPLADFFEDSTPDAEYKILSCKYKPLLRSAINNWNHRWLNAIAHQILKKSNDKFPYLAFIEREEGVFIYDSRSLETKEYKISELEIAMLEFLSKPQTLDDILSSLSSFTSSGITSCLDNLLEKDLVFADTDKYLSLVQSDHARMKDMTTIEFLNTLDVLSINLIKDNGNLRYKAKHGIINQKILEQIRIRKAEIIPELPFNSWGYEYLMDFSKHNISGQHSVSTFGDLIYK